jgi:hypothetical protein
MKTKNNVQKTILRSGAVIVSFVLISLTVSAQDFWKKLLTNSSFNEIALAMTKESNKPESKKNPEMSTSNAFYVNEESEETLKVEDWMENDNYFNGSAIQYKEEKEDSLNIENWMLNDSLFENVKTEAEPELKVESWMTSEKVWKM